MSGNHDGSIPRFITVALRSLAIIGILATGITGCEDFTPTPTSPTPSATSFASADRVPLDGTQGTRAVLYGPGRFVRESGEPTSFIEQPLEGLPFNVFEGPFILHVQNGSEDGKKRISSAQITLDGTAIFGPQDFNQSVGYLEREIALLPTSTLEVTLTSGPDAYLEIYISGVSPGEETKIPKTTVAMDPLTERALVAASPDLTTLTFSQNTPILEGLDPNDVLVSDPTDETPHGFMRKVISVKKEDGQVLLTTERATFEDAFEDVTIDLDKVKPEIQWDDIKLGQGVALKAQPFSAEQGVLQTGEIEYGIELALTDVKIADGITATGEVGYGLTEFTGDIIWEGWLPDQIDLGVVVEGYSDLQVTAVYEASFEKEKISLAEVPLGTITILVGGVPVVLTPELEIYLYVNGKLHGKLDVQTHVGLGVRSEFQWTAGEGASSSADPFHELDAAILPEANAELNAGIVVPMDVLIYGFLGPFASFELYAQGGADIEKDPWWWVDGGFKGDVGFVAEAWSREIARESVTVVDYTKRVVEATGGFTNLHLVTTSPLPYGIVDEPYSLALEAEGGIPVFAPYEWNLTSGSLPAGLKLSEDGTISGTPTQLGEEASFTIEVTSWVFSAERTFILAVGEPLSPLQIETASALPAATVGQSYETTLVASGGNGDYDWTNPGEGLPDGLTLSSSGMISGTPTAAGTSSFDIRVTSAGLQDTETFSITVAAPPGNSVILLEVSPPHDQTIGEGQSVGYELYATDGNGLPVDGATVEVRDGLLERGDQVTTDMEGYGVYQTTAPSGTQGGSYSLEFQARKANWGSSELVTRQITVVDEQAEVKLTISPNTSQTLHWGESVTYSFTSLDGDGNIVPFTTIGVEDLVMDVSAQLETDGNGETTYTTTAPDGKTAGIYYVIFRPQKNGYTSGPDMAGRVEVEEGDKWEPDYDPSLAGHLSDTDYSDNAFGPAVTHSIWPAGDVDLRRATNHETAELCVKVTFESGANMLVEWLSWSEEVLASAVMSPATNNVPLCISNAAPDGRLIRYTATSASGTVGEYSTALRIQR